MIKKSLFIFSLLTLLPSFVFNPGKEAKSVAAASVETGEITNNLVDQDNNNVDHNDNNYRTKEEKYFSFQQSAYYNEINNFDYSFMNSIIEHFSDDIVNYYNQPFGGEESTATSNIVYNSTNCSNNNVTDDLGNKVPYYSPYNLNTESTSFRTFTLMTCHMPINSFVTDWSVNEQPIEFRFDFLSEIDPYRFEQALNVFSLLEIQSFELPLLKINGEPILYLCYNDETNEYSFSGKNARVYPGVQAHEWFKGDSKVTGNYPDGSFYVEIPYRNYIHEVEYLYVNMGNSHVPVENDIPLPWSSVYFTKAVERNLQYSPFTFQDIDFNKGVLVCETNTANELVKQKKDYIKLNYITLKYLNNAYRIVTTPTGKYSNDGFYEEYKLQYYDSGTFKDFNYNSDHELTKALKKNDKDKTFYVANYNFSVIPVENSDGYVDKVCKNKLLEKASNVQTDNEYTAVSSYEYLVDYGTFYAFKYNAKYLIHEAKFKGYYGRTRLAGAHCYFTLRDLTFDYQVHKIKGLTFYYSYKGGRQKGLSLVSDKPVNSGNSLFLLPFTIGEVVTKTDDEYNIKFTLSACNGWDFWTILFSGLMATDLRDEAVADTFNLASDYNVEFKDMISAVYEYKTGDIVQLTNPFKDGLGATAQIDEDGNVYFVDMNGEKLNGYFVDKDGIWRDATGKAREPVPTIVKAPEGSNLLATIIKVLMFALIIYLIYKAIQLLIDAVNAFRKR